MGRSTADPRYPVAKSPLSMRVFEGKNRFPSFSAPDPRVSQQQAPRPRSEFVPLFGFCGAFILEVLKEEDWFFPKMIVYQLHTQHGPNYAEVCKDSITGFAEVRDQRESWHIDGYPISD